MHKIRLVLLALTWLFAASTPLHADDRPPNIVIIFTDDQGYADVGCFGAKGFETPNLDRLAREGRRFTNFHVAQPVCSASRAALLTGCYPNRIGIHGALGPGSKVGIADGETTLAEVLKTRGYATGMAGKWHLGHHPRFLPVRHGFDEYLGLPYSNDMWPRHPEAIPGTYPPLPLIDGDHVVDSEITAEDQRRLTGLYTERAVSFINRHKDRPFFFYLADSMPHVPLHVSDAYHGKSRRGLYGDVIEEIDGSVGEVMKALETNGLEKNTLVIFTSDNGPWLSYGDHAGSAQPLREGKGTCWEGGVRVPCIMRLPERIPAGTTSGVMLMTIDLLPTIARLAGAACPSTRLTGLTSGRSSPAYPARPTRTMHTSIITSRINFRRWQAVMAAGSFSSPTRIARSADVPAATAAFRRSIGSSRSTTPNSTTWQAIRAKPPTSPRDTRTSSSDCSPSPSTLGSTWATRLKNARGAASDRQGTTRNLKRYHEVFMKHRRLGMSATATSRTRSASFAWGPFVWVAGLHAGAGFAFLPAYFTRGAVLVCLFLMWLTGGIGICLTYHRLLTHRSFAMRPRWLEYVLTALGCCASQGGAVGWVADHRKHHALADLEEDVHSPRRSFAWAYTVWWMTPGVTASLHTAAYCQRWCARSRKTRFTASSNASRLSFRS